MTEHLQGSWTQVWEPNAARQVSLSGPLSFPQVTTPLLTSPSSDPICVCLASASLYSDNAAGFSGCRRERGVEEYVETSLHHKGKNNTFAVTTFASGPAHHYHVALRRLTGTDHNRRASEKLPTPALQAGHICLYVTSSGVVVI